MSNAIAVVGGVVCLIIGVYGLLGLWWAFVAAGVLMIVWAYLDFLGAESDGAGTDRSPAR